MSTPVGVIKKFVQALIDTTSTGEAAANAAFKAVGAVSYDTFKEKFHSAQSGLSTQDFLEQYCGIRVNNKDTGAITGSDAGGSTTKIAESIISEAAKAVSLTKAEYNSFTKNGLKVNVTYLEKDDTAAGEKYGYSGATYLAKQKLVVRALYNWWLPEALDLINESLGLNFTDGRANVNEINVVFDDDFGNNECATALEFNYDMGRASEIILYINANILYNMTANDKDGTLDSDKAIWTDFYGWHYMNGGAVGNLTPQFSNYLDRIILQSLAEVTIKSNVSYAYYLPKEITAGLCEIVGGFDSSNAYGQGNGLYSYAEDNWTTPHYGYGLMRYLAKNYSDGMPDGVSYNTKKTILTLTTDFTESAIDLANFESSVKTVKASSLKSGIKILGNDKANSILGGAGDDSLNGGKGNDTLNGGKGDDTLVGGAGNDVFIFTAGSDLIKDYEADDKISIGGTISDVTLDGTNVVFTVGKNILTVKDAADMTLTIINSKGKELETLISGASSLTLDNKSKATVTIDSDVEFVDASARTKNIKIAGNALDNTISGGSKNDSIKGGGGNDSLVGNAGKDTLNGGAGNDYLVGGDGKDTLIGGAGNDYISNYHGHYVTINAGAGDDTIDNGDYGGNKYVTITAGAGNDSVFNDNAKVSISGGKGNDTITNYESDNVTINGDEGNDTIENENGDKTSINGGAGDDYIHNYDGSNAVTIYGGEGSDTIENSSKDVAIDGGDGDDLITSKGNDCTLAVGAGNDLITSSGDEILFKYAPGDGDDTIDGFNAYSRIRIGDGTDTYSKETVGDDILISVGEGSVLLLGAAKLSEVYISGIEEQAGSSWTLNGTTATYGNKITVKGVTSTDGLSIKGKVVVISKASLGTGKVSITGDGYTLALADDVARTSTSEAWSLSKTTASYKRTNKAGYTLADNAKSITYSKKSVTTLVKVKGVTSLDGLKLSGTTVTVSAASLGMNDVTISDGYALKLGSDVESSSSKKSWSFSKSTAAYKQTTTEGYSLVDNEIIYSAAATKTLASVKGATTKSGLKVSGSTIKLPASALSSKVTVSGAYTFDFASDYSKATITGSSSDDTILARGKNILVKGGKGSDVFALKSTVANTINDYEEADKVSLLSGAAEISVNGDDVIFNGKVTVAGAIDKAVTYIEDDEEKIFKYTPAAVKFNAKGTSVTLLETYAEDSFDIADFSEYKNTVVTIKASAVQHSLEIFGNKNANKIFGTNEDDYIDGQAGADTISGGKGKDTLVGGKGNDSLSGGAGNDSLWGGAGDDTLNGGAGKDIFVYQDSDGSDVIEDFDASLDKIRVLSGDVSTPTVDSSGDVTFAVGDGEIVVKGGADKYIPVYDSGKNILMKYNPR